MYPTPEARAIETLFYIPDKSGKQVKFFLNESQKAYDDVRGQRDMVPKARQKGFSSLGIAYQVIDCLGKEGTRAVLISHEAKATQRLLDKARYYIEHMEGPQPELGRHSRNEFYFPKTESTFYIGTAGAKAFGRGDTITHLHISEYAWWEGSALRQVAGLFQAVPMSGTIRIESTGNGRGNDFYYMCMNAEELGYQVFFRSWHDDDEYQKPLPRGGYVPKGFEHYFVDMQLKYNLSDEQMYWYWTKLLEFRQDLNLMQQEYPSDMEECFRATGGQVFPNITRVKSEYWKWKVQDGRRIEFLEGHPRPKRTYVLGGDPSGGTGNDEAGATVLCIETLEQVFEFSSNRIDPVDFGYYLIELGKQFLNAYIVCEANNHGIATHSILLQNYPRKYIYKRHIPTGQGRILYGYMTSRTTKSALIGAIKELDDMGLSVYGTNTMKQIMEFEEVEEGKFEAPEDGLVIALGMASIGVQRYANKAFDISPEKPKEKIDLKNANFMTYTLDEALESIDKRNLKGYKGFPRMVN